MGKWYLRIIKRAEEEYPGNGEQEVKKRKKFFLNLYKHTFDHYTRLDCPPECPCNQFDIRDDEMDSTVATSDRMVETVLAVADAMQEGHMVQVHCNSFSPCAAENEKEIYLAEVVEIDGDEERPTKKRKFEKRWMDLSDPSVQPIADRMKVVLVCITRYPP